MWNPVTRWRKFPTTFTSIRCAPASCPLPVWASIHGAASRVWRKYVEYLGVIAADLADGREKFSRGWLVGSTEFAAKLNAELMQQPGFERRFELFGADQTALRQARSQLWEDSMRDLAAAWGIGLDDLPPLKSDPQKVMLATGMKAVTSVSNGWLARRLGMGQASSVSSLVTAFRRQGGSKSPDFKKVLSRFAI